MPGAPTDAVDHIPRIPLPHAQCDPLLDRRGEIRRVTEELDAVVARALLADLVPVGCRPGRADLDVLEQNVVRRALGQDLEIATLVIKNRRGHTVARWQLGRVATSKNQAHGAYQASPRHLHLLLQGPGLGRQHASPVSYTHL